LGLGEKICRHDFKRRWTLFGKCHEIWSRNLGMGRNREIGKDNTRLCKVDFWIEVLYFMIHSYKRAGEIKSRMRFKSKEI